MSEIFANGKSIVHAGDELVTSALAPDVCLTQAGPALVPVPFPNHGESSELVSGTLDTRIESNPVAVATSALSKTKGDEAGKLGIISQKTQGQVKWATHSLDVLFEGEGVVCYGDVTQHNANLANTFGLQAGSKSAKKARLQDGHNPNPAPRRVMVFNVQNLTDTRRPGRSGADADRIDYLARLIAHTEAQLVVLLETGKDAQEAVLVPLLAALNRPTGMWSVVPGPVWRGLGWDSKYDGIATALTGWDDPRGQASKDGTPYDGETYAIVWRKGFAPTGFLTEKAAQWENTGAGTQRSTRRRRASRRSATLTALAASYTTSGAVDPTKREAVVLKYADAWFVVMHAPSPAKPVDTRRRVLESVASEIEEELPATSPPPVFFMGDLNMEARNQAHLRNALASFQHVGPVGGGAPALTSYASLESIARGRGESQPYDQVWRLGAVRQSSARALPPDVLPIDQGAVRRAQTKKLRLLDDLARLLQQAPQTGPRTRRPTQAQIDDINETVDEDADKVGDMLDRLGDEAQFLADLSTTKQDLLHSFDHQRGHAFPDYTTNRTTAKMRGQWVEQLAGKCEQLWMFYDGGADGYLFRLVVSDHKPVVLEWEPA